MAEALLNPKAGSAEALDKIARLSGLPKKKKKKAPFQDTLPMERTLSSDALDPTFKASKQQANVSLFKNPISSRRKPQFLSEAGFI